MTVCVCLLVIQVFDLKGSMRSRYIDPSKDSSSDVLLDENFLNRKTYCRVSSFSSSIVFSPCLLSMWW